MSAQLHFHTPSLSGIDARGLPVVSVAYHRRSADDQAQAHIQRLSRDAVGRSSRQWDARLWADGGEAGEPNHRVVHSLSNRKLRIDSVDAGWHATLHGAGGQTFDIWDGRGTHRRHVFDEHLRPSSVHERQADGPERCVERYTYAVATEAGTNRCGQLIRHDDTAGSCWFPAQGLAGAVLGETRRFLASLSDPDWPSTMEGRDSLLERDTDDNAKAYTTRWTHDALGIATTLTDAIGNAQHTLYDVAGQVRQMSLLAAGEVTVVLDDLVYDAGGRMHASTTGTDIATIDTYSPVDGLLRRRQTCRPGTLLQRLDYRYDPVGHLLSVEDGAQATDWFAGSQVDAIDAYRYDTLYRLVEARGRESTVASIRPGLPDLGGPGGGADASRLRNYTQAYVYDAAGNLLTLTHGSGGQNQYTRRMAVATRSNRSLPLDDTNGPPDLDGAFDAHGNLLPLEGTRGMAWDGRNRLQRVTQVARDEGTDDDEVYVYDAAGQRLRKVRVNGARAIVHRAEVRYLPGLEIRSDTASAEILHVVTMAVGRSELRYLHWISARRALPPPQLRFSFDDHLGSATLELDAQGAVISHEGYYPYGGTAWWAARSAVDASNKTIRYSGKERDATGLYYYGARYYAAWMQRWTQPDPAGDVDGPNLYEFVASDPINHIDASGHAREDALRRWHLPITRRPAWVRGIAPGIVAVSVTGDAAWFESLGFDALSPSQGPRTLHYLAIDPAKYEGVVSGGKDLFNPVSENPGDFATYSGADRRTVAYINAAFYNTAYAADEDAEQHASIGLARSTLGINDHVPIPGDYAAHYRKIALGSGTFLHAAPALTSKSQIVFRPSPRDPLFLYAGDQVLTPGRLHHAAHPNARSGISLPSMPKTGHARIAVGMAEGRGPGSIGYTMHDWAQVMQRLDRMDDNAKAGIEVPHDSTNLDGGGSSMMGVIDGSGKRLYDVHQDKGRLISTTISFRDRTAPPPMRPAARNRRCCSIA